MRQFSIPLGRIANLYNTIQSAIAGAERVFETIDEQPEPPDAPEAVVLDKVNGEVVFDKVCFGYEKDVPILKNISLRVAPGQTFALVGPTGVGKTTIINLLTRFYDIDSGSIYIDGCDIRQIQRDMFAPTTRHCLARHVLIWRHGDGKHPLWSPQCHG